jgi:hypothetical protein
MPDPAEWMPVKVVSAPHPATLAEDVLLTQTQNRFQRRSGPGGQHRNKTSSGVFLLHDPTGVSAEATERRSQADNRGVATMRLRYKLAILVRTPSGFCNPGETIEQAFRQQYSGSRMKLSDANVDKPSVMALLMNDLHAAGGQPSLVAEHWRVSTSAILNLLRSQPDSFQWLNSVRRHHGRRPLK